MASSELPGHKRCRTTPAKLSAVVFVASTANVAFEAFEALNVIGGLFVCLVKRGAAVPRVVLSCQ